MTILKHDAIKHRRTAGAMRSGDGVDAFEWEDNYSPVQMQRMLPQQNPSSSLKRQAGAAFFCGQDRMAIRQGRPEYTLAGDVYAASCCKFPTNRLIATGVGQSPMESLAMTTALMKAYPTRANTITAASASFLPPLHRRIIG